MCAGKHKTLEKEHDMTKGTFKKKKRYLKSMQEKLVNVFHQGFHKPEACLCLANFPTIKPK